MDSVRSNLATIPSTVNSLGKLSHVMLTRGDWPLDSIQSSGRLKYLRMWCAYQKARGLNADIIIMLHPDYQYTPKLIHSLSAVIAFDVYPVVMGSRILGKGARKGGMPLYKYIANRFLTLGQNILLGQKLSEYHTGYRAFSKEIFEKIDIESNSDDFIFDNQMLAQIFYAGFEIGEITCPTKYFEEASSINFKRSVQYGLGVIGVSISYRMARWGIVKPKLFYPKK